MRVIQIVESLTVGDAVANDVVAIDLWLEKQGISRKIYVSNNSNISPKYLHKIAEPITCVPAVENDDVLLFHHAICNDFCYKLNLLKCHKILVYHNITPPAFFEGIEDGLASATRLGIDQLDEIKGEFECCIADSEFNKQNLIDMGYEIPIFVCPVLVPFRDYDQKPNMEIIQKYKNDDWVNVLFVGRISPQKKQQDIIHTFAIYKKYYNPKARLFLVGSDGMQNYTNMIKEYVSQINAKDVYITGAVAFEDILAYYYIADVFLCMSEHEGFCVPLLEAMYFEVPIIAYDSTAISGTLGETGVLLSKKDFLLAAGWIHEIITNKELSKKIVEDQWEHLKDYSYKKVINRLEALLKPYISDNRKQIEEVIISKPDNTYDFDVVIPIKASDWEVARKSVKYIQKNIRPKRIVIVSSYELKKQFLNNDYIVCIDEDELLEGLTIDNVRRVLRHAKGNPKIAGWYLQQFIKLGYSRVTNDKYYLVWDADMIPLNEITFFDKETLKPYFNLKREYVEGYFDTIKTLLGLDKIRNESFISEHMLFDSNLCKIMLKDIEGKNAIPGLTFWEKCIYASSFGKIERAFSEYETYGTYVSYKFPEAYQTRKLRTLRAGQTFLGLDPAPETLEWAKVEFDAVSFEHFDTVFLGKRSKYPMYRKLFSFKHMIYCICRETKFLAKVGNKKYKDRYSQLLPKLEFDYFFGDETKFERDIASNNNIAAKNI